MISQRPAEAGRAFPARGRPPRASSAIGRSRAHDTVHHAAAPPRMDGHGRNPPSRTAPRWPVRRRRCVTRSRPRSRRCPTSCVARLPGTRERRWPARAAAQTPACRPSVTLWEPLAAWRRELHGLQRQCPQRHRPDPSYSPRPRCRRSRVATRPRRRSKRRGVYAVHLLSPDKAVFDPLNPSCDPRSECTTVSPRVGCRRQRAISRASTTSSVRRWSAMDQPTIRRE